MNLDSQPAPAETTEASVVEPTTIRQPEKRSSISTPNLLWPWATFLLACAAAIYMGFTDNWGEVYSYLILAGTILVGIASCFAISYEKRQKPFLGARFRAYFLYGVLCIIGTATAAIGLGFGNMYVPYIFPFDLIPVGFYVLIATLFVLSVEFGLSIIRNYRNLQ